jgi:glycosyltransferase involved in cell wall biosynthesis
MDKYLWLGYCLSESRRKDILSKGIPLLSAHRTQSTLLEALRQSCGCAFSTINLPGVPTYPQFPGLFIRKEHWTSDQAEHFSVGYLNLKYITIISRQIGAVSAAMRWCRTVQPGQRPVIFVYSMVSAFMLAALRIKKKHPDTLIVQLVPDLPEYMDLHMSLMKKMLKRLDARVIKRCRKAVDKWVLFSRHMAERLGLEAGSWIVMEGCTDSSGMTACPDSAPSPTKMILYSGKYDVSYGIPELLQAFSALDMPDIELWFVGGGEAQPLIDSAAARDPRIKNLGYIENQARLREIQSHAALLVNVRDAGNPVFTYSFPSKLLDYMASHVPVLTTALPGIPEEYLEYLLIAKDNSPESIKHAIRQALSLPESERRSLAQRAFDFAAREKSCYVQARRILNFIHGGTGYAAPPA